MEPPVRLSLRYEIARLSFWLAGDLCVYRYAEKSSGRILIQPAARLSMHERDRSKAEDYAPQLLAGFLAGVSFSDFRTLPPSWIV